MLRRTIGMLVAVFFMGATLSLLIRVNLGTDPCSCMNLGIPGVPASALVPVSFVSICCWPWW